MCIQLPSASSSAEDPKLQTWSSCLAVVGSRWSTASKHDRQADTGFIFKKHIFQASSFRSWILTKRALIKEKSVDNLRDCSPHSLTARFALSLEVCSIWIHKYSWMLLWTFNTERIYWYNLEAKGRCQVLPHTQTFFHVQAHLQL